MIPFIRKMILAVLLLAGTTNFVFAQSTPPVEKDEALRAETKAVLISKLGLSDEASVKVLDIEEGFHAKLASIEGTSGIPVKEKEVKLNEAHSTRRASLLAIPLTGRQMEDAVEIVAAVRRKLKK